MRENVFLPAHLSKTHRNLIYAERHRKLLEDDPITVEVSGEVFQLKHIDRTKDQPRTLDSLWKFISLMRDKNDWENLPIFLEGLKTANRTLEPRNWAKLVRKAGQAGQQSTIIECARRASRTGFVLNNVNLVRDIMWWIQQKALIAGWTAQSTKKAFAMAEQVVDLMEEEKHCGSKSQLGPMDPRARPEVLGVLLQLGAASAKLSSSKDDDGKVEVYSRRLLGTLARKVNLRDELRDLKELWVSNALLCNIVPLVYGMRVAAEILGPASEVAKQLKQEEPALSAMVTDEYEKIVAAESGSASQRAGVWNYNVLLKSQQS